MPFTPYHFGPALALGTLTRKHLHLPTFLLATVILDLEPLLVLILNLSYPLHGLAHTFLLALGVGLLLGTLSFQLEGTFTPVWRFFQLELPKNYSFKSFLSAGILGTCLHVLLDSVLYSDIQPLFPSNVNPWYNPSFIGVIYGFCLWMGLLGLILYGGSIFLTMYRTFTQDHQK